ncbi:MAG: hydroxyacylglutathione hydrolase [Pseudomonadota bacterium]
MALKVHQFPCLEDNYGYLIHDPDSGQTATIDAPDGEEILRQLEAKGWALTHILTTHHHWDHTQGNDLLKERTACTIIGPEDGEVPIPGMDRGVREGDSVAFGGTEARVIETPGHTLDHIAYYFARDQLAFVGDTLFALGCGRLLEGTALQMWESLQKLMALPDGAKVFCGHEYTEGNARFAVTVDPDNPGLRTRKADIEALRAAGRPTIPTTIGLERQTNPFVRPHDASIRETLAMDDAGDADVFAEIRLRKDNF